MGVIAFATANNKQKIKIQEYLQKDSSIVSSSLIELIDNLKAKTNIVFSTDLLETVKPASAFLQYIVHALAVSGIEKVRDNLEGVLRASFVFEQARSEDPKLAEELIRIARKYIDHLAERKGKGLKGFTKLADGTGFSSPSVDLIMRDWKKSSPYTQEDWNPDKLFPYDGSANDTLVEAVKTISELPEVKLGSEETGTFSAERIARVTSAWVNGQSLQEIANNEYDGDVIKCVHHIYTKISNLLPWGLRGVQKVAFAGNDQADWEQLDLIPAMIYHGVRSREAIALRMLNVPRIVAEGLAGEYRSEGTSTWESVLNWLNHSNADKWNKSLPKNSAINGSECKILWEILEGKRSWNETFK